MPLTPDQLTVLGEVNGLVNDAVIYDASAPPYDGVKMADGLHGHCTVFTRFKADIIAMLGLDFGDVSQAECTLPDGSRHTVLLVDNRWVLSNGQPVTSIEQLSWTDWAKFEHATGNLISFAVS